MKIINLGNVVKYKREGYNYITLYFVNKNSGSNPTSENNLEKITIKNYEEVKHISDRVDKEMMQIGRIVKSESEKRMFVEYSPVDGGKYYVVYDTKTIENEETLKAIKAKQDEIKMKERQALQVKGTKKESRAKYLKSCVLATLVLAGIAAVVNNTNPNQNIKNHDYSYTDKSRPTIMPIPDTLLEFVHNEPVQTVVPTVEPQPVQTQRPMVIIQPEPVTNDQDDLLAVKRIRAALNESARIDSKSGTPNNTNSLYSDESILNTIKLINNDFGFLSIDDAARYDQLSQSIDIYKNMQIAYLLNGQEGAKISDYTKDPYRKQKLVLVEQQAKEFIGNKTGNDGVMPIKQTHDENDSLGDLIVSGYINISWSFSTRAEDDKRIQSAINELDNKERVFDDCAGIAKHM